MDFILDIETNMEPTDTIRTVGLYQCDTMHCRFFHGPGQLTDQLLKLEEGDVVYTWNGARFDLPVLEKLWGMDLADFKFKHIDMMIVAKMALPNLHSHSLANMAIHFNPSKYDLHKMVPYGEGKKWKNKEDFHNHCPIGELEDYCLQDLRVTDDVTRHIKYVLTKIGGEWKHPVAVEHSIAEITNRQCDKKVQFNRTRAATLHEEIKERMAEIEKELEPHMPIVPMHKPHMPPKVQFKKDGSPSALITSYIDKYGWELKLHAGFWTAQKDGPTGMGKLICTLPLTEPLDNKEKLTLAQQPRIKDWLLEKGWKPTMFNSKKGKDGRWVNTTPRLTDKITKEPCPNLLRMGITWVPLFSEWLMLRSRANLLISDKGTGWWFESGRDLNATVSTGYLASDADTVGANTGRYRHRGIVNIPRVSSAYGKEFRGLFEARHDKVWVGWDASSLEACMEAHYVYPYDPDYANALVNGNSDDGTDVHSLNMKRMGLPNRDVAKTFKYAVTYGAQPAKLAESLNVSRAQANIWFDEFWSGNPGLLNFKTKLEREWEEYDRFYIVGLDGRLIGTRSKHSLVNAKFQSAGAIVMKHACLLADKRIRAVDWAEEAPYGLIRYHDEEVWECFEWQSSKVLYEGIRSIEDAGRFLKLNVPITGAGKIGKNWAEVH